MSSEIVVVENRDTPAGFVSFGRGSFRTLAAARKAATKRVASGETGVIIVHDQASVMNNEAWVVGRVASTVEEQAAPATLTTMDETAYLTKVRQVLDELGSPDSSADITASGDYWKHCRHAGIEAKVCAATIYTGERHRHEIARTVIKEAAEAPHEWSDVQTEMYRGITVLSGRIADDMYYAKACDAAYPDSGIWPSLVNAPTRRRAIDGVKQDIDKTIARSTRGAGEAPVREEWEVVVKRAGVSPDDITSAAGRRPDEVTSGNAVFAGFKDDEKAATFSKKMTKAGYISSFGPRRDYTLHEAPRAKDIDEHALEELDMYIENTAELYPQKKAILRNLEAKIARGTYDAELAPKLWLYWVDEGAKMYAKEFADAQMWKVIYPKPLRMELARRIARREYAELQIQRGGASSNVVAEVAGETPAAASSDVAEECASCIPWQKVSRDADAAAANNELAKKYGAIKNAKDVYRVVGDAMNKETQEVFLVIPLDLRGELKCAPYEVARGQVSRVSVDTADVLRAALHAGAEAYICVHQHPTGKATPSKADRDLTKSIKDATAVYGKSLTYVDHVVIGQKRAYSIGESKMYKCE